MMKRKTKSATCEGTQRSHLLAIVTTIVLCLAVLLVGCGRKTELQQVIESYNQSLVAAHNSQDSEKITDVSPGEKTRVGMYIVFNMSKNQKMELILHKLTIVSEKINYKKAVVDTEENWSYRYLATSQSGESTLWQKIRYKTKYKLIKSKKKWLVDNVDAREIKD